MAVWVRLTFPIKAAVQPSTLHSWSFVCGHPQHLFQPLSLCSAADFGSCLLRKYRQLGENFSIPHLLTTKSTASLFIFFPSFLLSWKSFSCSQLLRIPCPLVLIKTWLLKLCPCSWIINFCLSTGPFPSAYKQVSLYLVIKCKVLPVPHLSPSSQPVYRRYSWALHLPSQGGCTSATHRGPGLKVWAQEGEGSGLWLFILNNNLFSAYKYILMIGNPQIMEKYKK